MTLVRKLARGTNLAAPGKKEMTLMWFAVVRQNYPAVQTLVELRVNPRTQTVTGPGNVLNYAMESSREDSNG